MRYGTKSAVEDYRALDVRRLARSGMLVPGHAGLWCWWRGGELVASINVRADTKAVHLSYRAGGEPMSYRVMLDHTRCHYGGSRAWFLCPAVGCGRRVARLYGGKVFACRHCHQLNYASQQWSKRDWGNNRSWRLRLKLGCEWGWMDMPAEYVPRPKGKHRETHARALEHLARYDAHAEASFNAVSAAFMKRLGRLEDL